MCLSFHPFFVSLASFVLDFVIDYTDEDEDEIGDIHDAQVFGMMYCVFALLSTSDYFYISLAFIITMLVYVFAVHLHIHTMHSLQLYQAWPGG